MIALVSLLVVMLPSFTLFNGVAMQHVVDRVYVEQPATDADREAVIKAVNAAYAKLRDAFGEDESFEAVVFICRTATCKAAFGASPRVAHAADLGFAAVSVPNVPKDRAVVVTGPNASTTRVLTHELVHALMKSWVPYDALPTWFNEGIATAIADEPSCVGFAPASEMDVTALVTKADWQASLESTGETLRMYCQARYATEAWSSFGGKRELAVRARALAKSVSHGDPGTTGARHSLSQ